MIINGQEVEKIVFSNGEILTDLNYSNWVKYGDIVVEKDTIVKDSKQDIIKTLLKSAREEGTFCINLYNEIKKALSMDDIGKPFVELDFSKGATVEDILNEMSSFKKPTAREIVILLYAIMLTDMEAFENLMVTYIDKYGKQRYLFSYEEDDPSISAKRSREKMGMLDVIKSYITGEVVAEESILNI